MNKQNYQTYIEMTFDYGKEIIMKDENLTDEEKESIISEALNRISSNEINKVKSKDDIGNMSDKKRFDDLLSIL